MADFLRVLAEWAQYLWPLHIVSQWERAGLYVFGRFVTVVGPGLWPKIPWFMMYIDVSTVPSIGNTVRLDITTKDNRALSFSAAITYRVVDVAKALNDVDSYEETTQELAASILAAQLAEVEPERLLPERRARLTTSALGWVQAEAAVYGVEIEKVRFTTFVLGAKTFRLLTDTVAATSWSGNAGA